MFWSDGSERTIPATPRRKAEARRQGRLPFSPDLHTALMWGGMALLLIWQGPSFVNASGKWLWQSLMSDPVLRSGELTFDRFAVGPLLGSVAGWLISLWIASAVVHWLQVRPVWAPENVLPRVDRLNPLSGLGRLFSRASCVRGGLWLVRLGATAGTVTLILYSDATMLTAWPAQSPGTIAVQSGEFLVSFAWKLCAVLFVAAAIDLGWQWWRHEQSLRMSAEEWRTELRDGERRQPVPFPSDHGNQSPPHLAEAGPLRGIDRS